MNPHAHSNGVGLAPDTVAVQPPRVAYLTTKDAAHLLGLHPDTLRRLRREGGGPPFVRIGHAVRYRLEAIDAWAKARTFKSNADEAARHVEQL